MSLIKIKLLTVAALLFASTSAFASYGIDFDVNTTSLASTNGYIDLQFNNGNAPATAAYAYVGNFISDATLNGAAFTVGAVSGALPGAVTIGNTGGMNDYFQALTFGNSVHFHVDMDQAINNSFYLSFFGQDGMTTLLSANALGYAAEADVLSNGSLSLTSFSDQATASQTPIPAAAWLLGSGLMGLAGIRKRKNG